MNMQTGFIICPLLYAIAMEQMRNSFALTLMKLCVGLLKEWLHFVISAASIG